MKRNMLIEDLAKVKMKGRPVISFSLTSDEEGEIASVTGQLWEPVKVWEDGDYEDAALLSNWWVSGGYMYIFHGRDSRILLGSNRDTAISVTRAGTIRILHGRMRVERKPARYRFAVIIGPIGWSAAKLRRAMRDLRAQEA